MWKFGCVVLCCVCVDVWREVIRTPADHTLLSGEAEENMLTGWTTFDLQTGDQVSPDGMKVLCLCLIIFIQGT